MLKNWTLCVLVAVSSILPTISKAVVEYSDGSVVALYHLDGDSVDSSGNGANGNDTGMTYPMAGKFEEAGRFVNTYPNNDASIVSDLGVNLSTYTINLWINSSTTQANIHSGIISSGAWNTNGNFYLEANNYSALNKASWQTYGEVADVALVSTSTIISTDGWKMFTFTNDAATKIQRLYINGTLDTSTTKTTLQSLTTNTDFYIGTWKVGANYRGLVSGYIDEVAIFNTVLSSTEISTLYNSGTGNTICTSTGCATPSSTPSSTVELCTGEACTKTVEHLYLWIVTAVFSLGGILGYKIMT